MSRPVFNLSVKVSLRPIGVALVSDGRSVMLLVGIVLVELKVLSW